MFVHGVCARAHAIDTVYLVFFEMETDKDVQFLGLVRTLHSYPWVFYSDKLCRRMVFLFV